MSYDRSNGFPDPALADFESVRRIMQQRCPDYATVANIQQVRLSTTSYHWQVNYLCSSAFPSPNTFECSRAKAIFQKACPLGASVGTVGTTMSSSLQPIWTVTYKRKRLTFSTIIFSKIFCSSSSRGKRQEEKLKFSKSKLTDQSFEVKRLDSILRLKFSDIKSDDIPRKVFLNHLDCTRLACGKTRFSHSTYRAYIAAHDSEDQGMSKPLRPIAFVKSTEEQLPIKDKIDSSIICSRVEVDDTINETTTPVSRPNITAGFPPPAVYHKNYLALKLRDHRLYALVRNYLARGCYGFIGTRQRSVISYFDNLTMFDIELALKSDGFPIGEDLLNVYLDYCLSLGQQRSSVVQNLMSVYSQMESRLRCM